MANGKKNYFRHSFFARNDIKLLQLRDRIGVGFYFYFFTLLELCGEQSADELQPFYEFHDSTIRNLWCVNLKKSERIANEMHAVCLLKFEKREKSFRFEIPNLAKYLGKYTIKNESKPVSKEKESKEKKNKVKKEKSPTIKKHDVLGEFCDYEHLFCNISKSTQKKFAAKYQLEYILEQCERAEIWLEDEPGRAFNGKFFSGWLDRGYDEWLRKNNRLPLAAEKKLIIPKMTDEEFPWPDLLD